MAAQRAVEQRQTKVFYLPESVNPYNGRFLQRVRQRIGEALQMVSLDAKRPRSGDLFPNGPVAQEHAESNAVFIGSFGGIQESLRSDSRMALFMLTNADAGLNGKTMLIAPYFEARDDRPLERSKLEFDARLLRAATEDHPLAVIALWEPHSPALPARLRELYARPEDQPEVVALTAAPLFADKLRELGAVDDRTIVLSPDLGSLERAYVLGRELNKPVVFAHKTRPDVNQAVIDGYYILDTDGTVRPMPDGYMQGARVVAMDDMIDTGGTAAANLRNLKQQFGAAETIFCATHAILSMPDAEQNLVGALNRGDLDRLIITDSLPNCGNIQHPNIDVVSLVDATAALAKMFAGVASKEERILVGRSLFEARLTKPELMAAFEAGVIDLSSRPRSSRRSSHSIIAQAIKPN